MENENYILFEDYIANQLSKEEAANFEFRLKTEPEFNQAFNTYKELSFFLEDKVKNEEESKTFQNNLERISKSYFNKEEEVLERKTTTKTFQLFKYAIAACVVLLFGIFTFNQFSNPSFSDYNHYDSISLTVRGQQDELLKTAEDAFNNKNFAKAEQAFKSLIAADNDNAELKLYRGISNIELNNFEIADSLLKDLSNGSSAYKQKVIWYLALSKLKQNDNAACLDILRTISEDSEDYKRAQKLINKLD